MIHFQKVTNCKARSALVSRGRSEYSLSQLEGKRVPQNTRLGLLEAFERHPDCLIHETSESLLFLKSTIDGLQDPTPCKSRIKRDVRKRNVQCFNNIYNLSTKEREGSDTETID